ncbi:MAG: serine hydrolase [Candidatus Eremiobacteraeota bacterium]|nr:serine hydrolase [Candidatus Eremiobacteraeota bacterium]MBC5821620.1 serine hydrolase [Candidatus Eremiobacteraeota bacterium]
MTGPDPRLTTLADECGLGTASIAVRFPLDDARPAFDLASDRSIYPASMIKTPIAIVLAAQVAAGARRLDDGVVVEQGNMTANDAPSPFVPGYRARLGELGAAMLTFSDNVATNVLIDVLGREALTTACRALGLSRTAVHRKLSGDLPLIDDPQASGRNAHPACDAARAFELVAAAARGGQRWVYDALRAQHFNGKLSRGWQAADVFAHKTGDTDEVSHDGGILTLPDGRSFVVVVYTEAVSDPQSDANFAAFARGLRPLLAQL